MTAALDHSPNSRFYCLADNDGAFLAVTGEYGDEDSGGEYACGARGQKNAFGSTFLIYGDYNDDILYYDGHPGYDWDDLKGGTIVAAAEGVLILPATDPISGSKAVNPYCQYHTFAIKHEGGWSTWYLHSTDLLLLPEDFDEEEYCSERQTEDLVLGEVEASQELATISNFGLNAAPGKNTHLHFELRHNDRVVDPFGWEWLGDDPLAANQSAIGNSEILWNGFSRPDIRDITSQPLGDELGYSLIVEGATPFSAGDLLSVWHKGELSEETNFWLGGYWKGTPTPTEQSIVEGRLILKLVADELDNEDLQDISDLVVKVKSAGGPRSLPYALTEVPEDSTVVDDPQPERQCDFTDLVAQRWDETFILNLCRRGVMTGDGDTRNVRPEDNVNRVEFIKLLVTSHFVRKDYSEEMKMKLLSDALELHSPPFPDVSATAWYAPYVAYAKDQDLVQGFPDGDFKPENVVNRAEAAKILLDAFKLADRETVADPYMNLADTCDEGQGQCPVITEALPAKHDSLFSDVQNPTEWFYYYIYGLEGAGIADGYETGNFGVSDPVRRNQAAKMICLMFFENECENAS